jgi:hypothetical protein
MRDEGSKMSRRLGNTGELPGRLSTSGVRARFNGATIQGFNPSLQLLLMCTRTAMAEAHLHEAQRLLHAGMDWECCLRNATRHRVAPLLYRNVKKHFADQVPTWWLQRLQDHYYANLTSSVLQTRELLRLAELFRAANIPLMAFKGPALGAAAYGDMALRQCGDLDLLIRRRDILAVSALLQEQGYQPYLPLPPRQMRYYLVNHHEHAFQNPAMRLTLDVHWALMPPYYAFSLDSRGLWQRCTAIDMDGGRVLTLAPEDHLLFLCQHGAKHHWETLGWVCDISEILGSCPALDWQQVMEKAVRSGMLRMLALGLLLVQELLGTDIPDEVWPRVAADSLALWLAKAVVTGFLRDSGGGVRDLSALVNLYHLRAMSLWRDRFLSLAEPLMVPTYYELSALYFPPGLYFLYYLFRPLRLAIRDTQTVLRRLLVSKGTRGGPSSVARI